MTKIDNQNKANELLTYMSANAFSDIQSITEYHGHSRNIIISANRNNNNYQINLCDTQIVLDVTAADGKRQTHVYKYGESLCI